MRMSALNWKPFVYGGLASITAECGKERGQGSGQGTCRVSRPVTPEVTVRCLAWTPFRHRVWYYETVIPEFRFSSSFWHAFRTGSRFGYLLAVRVQSVTGRTLNLLPKQKSGGSSLGDVSPSRPCAFPHCAPLWVHLAAEKLEMLQGLLRARFDGPSLCSHFLMCTWRTSCDFLPCRGPHQIPFIPLFITRNHSFYKYWLSSCECQVLGGTLHLLPGSGTAGLGQANPRSRWGPGLEAHEPPTPFPCVGGLSHRHSGSRLPSVSLIHLSGLLGSVLNILPTLTDLLQTIEQTEKLLRNLSLFIHIEPNFRLHRCKKNNLF